MDTNTTHTHTRAEVKHTYRSATMRRIRPQKLATVLHEAFKAFCATPQAHTHIVEHPSETKRGILWFCFALHVCHSPKNKTPSKKKMATGRGVYIGKLFPVNSPALVPNYIPPIQESGLHRARAHHHHHHHRFRLYSYGHSSSGNDSYGK